MDHLRNEIKANDSVLFLTPCHSTPYYSYLHSNISMNFLTCEPNLENKSFYLDEADKFFAQPSKWIKKKEIDLINKSSYIVLFDNLYDQLENSTDMKILEIFYNKFYLCNKFFYSFTKQTQNTGKKLLLLCLRKQKSINLNSKSEF